MTDPLEKVYQVLNQAQEEKIFSAAQLWVGQGQNNLFKLSFGRLSESSDSLLVTENSLIDIASLTKVVFATSVAMQLFEEGTLDLETPIQKFFPKLSFNPKILVQHLLSHRSGLPDWRPFYLDYDPESPSKKICLLRRQEYFKKISELKLKAPPGKKRIYSDLGFILLAKILEEVGGSSLKELWQERVQRPLGLKKSFFGPVDSKTFEVAATEHCRWRKKLIQGEVHDQNTYALGGVSTHAGLFSTAGDLEIWIHELWRVLAGKSSWLKKQSLLRFLQEPKLGWDSVSQMSSQAGTYFSKASFGHLAFTGCSLWLDPEDQKYVIFLTNRVLLSCGRPQAIKRFRPKLHDVVLEALLIKKSLKLK